MTITIHPSECGPCADCQAVAEVIAQKIADDIDAKITYAILNPDVKVRLRPDGEGDGE